MYLSISRRNFNSSWAFDIKKKGQGIETENYNGIKIISALLANWHSTTLLHTIAVLHSRHVIKLFSAAHDFARESEREREKGGEGGREGESSLILRVHLLCT